MTKKLLLKILLFLLVASAICYVPLRTYKQNGTNAVFSYFAPDAFYYLNVASQSAGKSIYTFDGTNPTNGFHPLWQYYLAYSFNFIHAKDNQLLFAFFSSMLLTALGFGLILLALLKFFKYKVIILITLLPGYFYLLFSFILNHYYNPWSNINGMESCLSVLFLGILLVLLINFNLTKIISPLKMFILSIALSLIGFARLDDFLLLIPFVGAISYYHFRAKNLKIILPLIIFPLLSIILYLAYNYTYSGMFLPASGSVKASFEPLNILHLLNIFTIGSSINYLSGSHLAVRALPIAFSCLVGVIYLASTNKQQYKNINNIDYIFRIFAFYLVLKSVIVLLFADFWHQGTWYFTDSIILSNIIIGYRLNKFISEVSEKLQFNRKRIKYISFILYFLFLAVMLNSIIEMKRFNFNEQYSKFYNEQTRLSSELKPAMTGKGVIEFDDGILSYSLALPCLSGFGLAADKEIISAIKSGNMLDVAYRRGFRTLGSLNYFKNPAQIPDTIKSIKDFCRMPFFALDREDQSKWRFSVLMKNKLSRVVFIRFEKKY